MKHWIVLLMSMVLHAEEPDFVFTLVERMRDLTAKGDQAAISRLVPELTAALAKPNPNAPLAWNQIGVFYSTQGSFAEAERAFKRGIRLIGEADTVNGDLALLTLNLGELYLESGGRPAHAEMLIGRALALATRALGPDAPELANFVYMLGSARRQLGDRKGARRQFERALSLTRGEGRDSRIRRGLIMGNLAVLLADDNRWAEARQAAVESIKTLEQTMGPSHPELIRPRLNLGRIFEHLKQWDQAGENVERARAITQDRLGPEHLLMAEILSASASILRKTGHGRQARELDRRAKSIAAAQPRNPSASAWIDVSDLAGAKRH